ncbi:MAG: thioredoxin [Flavobacteriaceae bacterium]|jgi:hypothetical protein|nr:thioredoxin [Flavobacteriaceae bacterium]
MKIKQLLLLLPVFSVLMSCSAPERAIINKKIIDPEGEPMLIGHVTREALTAPEFNDWFSKEYDAYIPDPNVIKKLKGRARLYDIEIYFGTWCSDSHEQLPRLLKILDEMKYPEKNLSMYALNRKKESFYGEQAQKGIDKVPTFIITKGYTSRKVRAREIGRIIETPTEKTLELDLYKILIGKNYGEDKKK